MPRMGFAVIPRHGVAESLSPADAPKHVLGLASCINSPPAARRFGVALRPRAGKLCRSWSDRITEHFMPTVIPQIAAQLPQPTLPQAVHDAGETLRGLVEANAYVGEVVSLGYSDA